MAIDFTNVPFQEIAVGDLIRGAATVSTVREIRKSRIRPGAFIIILKNGQMLRVEHDGIVSKAI